MKKLHPQSVEKLIVFICCSCKVRTSNLNHDNTMNKYIQNKEEGYINIYFICMYVYTEMNVLEQNIYFQVPINKDKDFIRN